MRNFTYLIITISALASFFSCDDDYNIDNKEKFKEYRRRYYLKNKEKVK